MNGEEFDKERVEQVAYYKQVGIDELLEWLLEHKERCFDNRCLVCMEHNVVIEEIRERLETNELT